MKGKSPPSSGSKETPLKYPEPDYFNNTSSSDHGRSTESANLNLSWQNLNVWCTRKINRGFWKGNLDERIQILDNVNGSIESGSLTAIMGPSGAGKTTLLAAISMRVQGDISGNLMLNGYPITKKILTKISAIVPQDDLTIDSLTVLEHMLFMAKMKMDCNIKEATRKNRVKELICEMGLTKCSGTKIEEISGGERKRLSLAVQLINNPPILFCDEPTTGQDSWAAATVVTKLRSLAESGRAVLCVLHQPASDTFHLFHKLMLVSNGKIAYHGALNGASLFFKQQGFNCPIGYNEAEFLVNTISTEDGSRTICSAWKAKAELSYHNEVNNSLLDLFNENVPTQSRTKPSFNDELRFQQHLSIAKPSTLSQFYWLLWRSTKASMNKKRVFVMEFLALMCVALIVAIPYQNVLLKMDQQNIRNIQGLMQLIISNIIFTSIYRVFDTFSLEMPIFMREVANNLYSLGPYYLSKAFIIIPKTVIQAFMYTCLIYWIVGLNGGFLGVFIFTIPVICAACAANAYGAWLSTSFRSIETLTLVSMPLDFLNHIFDGYYININSLGFYISWMKYLSVFYYSSEAVSILQWSQIDHINCDPRPELTCITSGSDVLKYFGFGKNNLGFDLLGLLGIYLGFHILALISLWRRSKKEPVY